jgi:hypothetical protein
MAMSPSGAADLPASPADHCSLAFEGRTIFHGSTSSPAIAQDHNESLSRPTPSGSSSATPVATPMTSVSSHPESDPDAKLRELDKYIALGCLHFNQAFPPNSIDPRDLVGEWIELLFPTLPDEVKHLIGNDISRLLEASWIRLFLHYPSEDVRSRKGAIIRVYLLPEDWGRRFIDRRSKTLKLALRGLLHRIDISPKAWSGDFAKAEVRHFDPWATAEDVSLFYLFNKLPSPAPSAEKIKNRYARNAVWALLDSVSTLPEDVQEQRVIGLKTSLYPYQARSAAAMVQREAAPQLQLDPRLEVRVSPLGTIFYFGARDGSFLKEPRFYETNRGGILAETMVS